jgi:hypothetical protein
MELSLAFLTGWDHWRVGVYYTAGWSKAIVLSGSLLLAAPASVVNFASPFGNRSKRQAG